MGQTERFRRKGQSSFNVLMRGSPDALGSEELFVPRNPRDGWSLCPYLDATAGWRNTAFREGPCPQQIALQTSLYTSGQ